MASLPMKDPPGDHDKDDGALNCIMASLPTKDRPGDHDKDDVALNCIMASLPTKDHPKDHDEDDVALSDSEHSAVELIREVGYQQSSKSDDSEHSLVVKKRSDSADAIPEVAVPGAVAIAPFSNANEVSDDEFSESVLVDLPIDEVSESAHVDLPFAAEIFTPSKEEIPIADVQQPSRCSNYVCFPIAAVAISLIAVLGGTCISGRCKPRSTDSSGTIDEALPGLDPIRVRSDEITSFINQITLQTQPLAPDLSSGASVADLSLAWIIDEDPLQLQSTNKSRLQQRYAMANLYHATQPWDNSTGWLSGADECDWYGVTCAQVITDVETGTTLDAVSEIGLKNNGLMGTLPDDVGLLTDLSVLSLDLNTIFGTLPDTWGGLTSLTKFSAAFNALTGTLPSSFGKWTNLEIFSIAKSFAPTHNEVRGPIPESVGQWTNLARFDASRFEFVGTLPESIGQWTKLSHCSLDSNTLEGFLPDTIGQWTMLKTFSVSTNFFKGPLPSSIGKWTSLEVFRAGGNRGLNESLPEGIGAWKSLRSFAVDKNKLTGKLPEAIGEWVNIEFAKFDSNSFSGTIPSSLQNWHSIVSASFDDNNLSGTVPSFLENWKNSSTVSFEDNHLTGTVPAAFCERMNTSYADGKFVLVKFDEEVDCSCCDFPPPTYGYT